MTVRLPSLTRPRSSQLTFPHTEDDLEIADTGKPSKRLKTVPPDDLQTWINKTNMLLAKTMNSISLGKLHGQLRTNLEQFHMVFDNARHEEESIMEGQLKSKEGPHMHRCD